jgi:hypothetical protein
MTEQAALPGMEGQEIKFVAFEVLRKDATGNAKAELGLFRGIRMRSDQTNTEAKNLITFFLISEPGKKNEITAFSNTFYNILSMTIKYGTTKELVVWKCTAEDQALALEVADGVLKTLVLEKKMLPNDPDIIDLDKYVDLPYNLKEAKTTNPVGVGNAYNRNVGHTTDDWEVRQKKEKEEKERQEKLRYTPYMVKRVGDLPPQAALNSIKKKVLEIATGEYKSKPIPILSEKTECKGSA